MKTIRLLNVDILSVTQDELLKSYTHGVLVTPNVDHLMKLQKDKEFYSAYQHSEWVVCDSMILSKAANFIGKHFDEIIRGSSLFPAYYNYHKNNTSEKIFILGGKLGIAEIAKNKINEIVGREIIVDTYSPSFGFENNKQELAYIINKINNSGACTLAVCLGAPKQEKFIYNYRQDLFKINKFMALGATVDFEAGTTKRAPRIFQQTGLEWLYRLCIEPRRLFKRYIIDDLPFFILIIKQKMGSYQNPFRSKNDFEASTDFYLLNAN